MRPAFPQALIVVAMMPAMACAPEPAHEPNYAQQVVEAREVEVVAQMRAVWDALTMYRLHVGEYPGGEAGLHPLLATATPSADWKGPYLRRVPDDPWDTPLMYERGEEGITLRSAGPDGQAGTGDDIVETRTWAELR